VIAFAAACLAFPRRVAPVRDGATFLNKAVKPHARKDIHVVLDNLSTR
jgi:hypothetical protein